MSDDPVKEKDPNNFDIEYKEKVTELYKGKSASFQKLFSIFFVFSVIFLFVILLPYVSILQRNNEINHQLSTTYNDLIFHQNTLTALKLAQNGTLLLNNTLSQTPENMQLNNFKSIINQMNISAGQTASAVIKNLRINTELNAGNLIKSTFFIEHFPVSYSSNENESKPKEQSHNNLIIPSNSSNTLTFYKVIV